MAFTIGRGVRVEISNAEAAAVVVSAVSAAKPPVATAAAHGLALKSVGYFGSAPGIPQLVGQVARLNPITAGNFTLEDLDGTAYPALSGNANFVPVSSWLTLGNTTDYDKSGGEADKLEVTVLLDEIRQEENGLLAAEAVQFTLRSETISSAAQQRVREVARQNGYLVFRLTLKDGNVRVFRGQPSLLSETIGQGAVGSANFSVTVKGFVNEGAV